MQVDQHAVPPKVSAVAFPRLRDLEFSADVNPLVEAKTLTIRRKHVRTGLKRDLVSADGEITHAAVIHEVIEQDDAQFVKVFAAGVRAIYELSRSASRVFHTVLELYQAEPMQGGFADSVYLCWYKGGLNGTTVAGMSEATFNRGLRELNAKGFLAPRRPSTYWVNPSLFFKGDRVLFMREYVRRRNGATRPPGKVLGGIGQPPREPNSQT